MVRQALPLLLAGVLIGQLQQGPVIYYRWVGRFDLGQLSVLIQFISTLAAIPMAGMQAILPAVSRKTRRNEEEARMLTRRIIAFILLGAMLAGLLSMALAPAILLPLVGEQYAFAIRHMGLAVRILGMFSSALTINQLLTARGNYLGVLVSIAFGVLFMISGFLFARPQDFLLALGLGGLGYFGWILLGSAMLAMAKYLLPRLLLAGVLIAFPYQFGQALWSIGVGIVFWFGIFYLFYKPEFSLLLRYAMGERDAKG
jgi:O-antigen/teichoic acid export membrane protein